MSLQAAVIAVVAVDDAACERWAAPLRAAGAVVQKAIVNVNALATLSAPGFDAAVLDVGTEPELFVPLAREIRADARTRGMRLVVPLCAALAPHRLAGFGAIHAIACDTDATFTQALSELVEERRGEIGAAEQGRMTEDRLRTALERIHAMRSEAQALTHDARVLCGIVVGFAANLRDGIAGPLDSSQRGHVDQILEAANDTAAMLERFASSARAHAELPGSLGTVPPPSPRTARRTLLDLCELARTTLQLFATVAERKSMTMEFEASEPVSLWGDAMQIKQIVTNLLVNALKFTPAGGRVTVSVNAVAPSRTASGVAARHRAELIVRDTGPGIPADERERIFERGVRLARDHGVPGSGIGLAVVREIVAMHGGAVRVEQAPGGGAVLVVELPLDMRSRREHSLMVVDDPDAARLLVAAIRAQREWTKEALSGGSGLALALEVCRAIIVVPRGPRGVVEELLAACVAPSSGPPERGGR